MSGSGSGQARFFRAAPVTDRVVLFIHGAGTPAEVAFDVPYQDYSWMAYLAQAGFDVFAMDNHWFYGRSTRPTAMNDPCNLTREQQAAFVPTFSPHLRTELPAPLDHNRIRLERHRRGGRLYSNAAACR